MFLCTYLGLPCNFVRDDDEWGNGRVSLYEAGDYTILHFRSGDVMMGATNGLTRKLPSFVYSKRMTTSSWYVFSIDIADDTHPSTLTEVLAKENGEVIRILNSQQGPAIPSGYASNPFAHAFYTILKSLPDQNSPEYPLALSQIAISQDDWLGGKRRAFVKSVKTRHAFKHRETAVMMILYGVVEFEPFVH